MLEFDKPAIGWEWMDLKYSFEDGYLGLRNNYDDKGNEVLE